MAGPTQEVAAQQITCPPGITTTTCTVSTSHHETDIPVAGTTVTAPEPLQTQLTQALSGPNGAAIQAELNALGVLGPPGPGVKVSLGTTTTVTNTLTIGPGTDLVGPDQILIFFVPAGTINTNINTAFESFFELFAGSQALTTKGVNWLSGDLYTTVQTELLDDGFHFVDGLFGYLRGGSAGAVSAGPLPFAAPGANFGGAGFPLSDDALGYAAAMPAKAPRGAAYRGNGWTAWAAGSGTFARVRGDDSNFGFGYRTASFAGGMQKQAGLWLYGAAFSIGQSRLTQDSTTDSATVDSRRFAAYAAWQGMPFTVSAVLAYGNHSVDGNRLTLLPSLGAQASYNANSLDGGVEVSKVYSWGTLKVQPLLGLVYDGLWTDGFIESGGSLLGINANAAYVDALKGYAGARVYRTFVMPNGMTVTPELRARVVYDFLNGARGFNATFTGDATATSFAVNGLQPDRTSALLGAGITAKFAQRWSAFANYDADLRGNEVAQIVSGGFKVTW